MRMQRAQVAVRTFLSSIVVIWHVRSPGHGLPSKIIRSSCALLRLTSRASIDPTRSHETTDGRGGA